MRQIWAASVLVALLVTTGCSGSSSGAGPATSESAAPTDSFDSQSDYSQTTCEQWLTDMSHVQQVAAAAEFLSVLHARVQTKAFAQQFAGDISKACQPAPQLRLAEAVAGIATLDPTDFPG